MPNKIQSVQVAPAPTGFSSYLPEGGKVKAMASSLFAKENLIFAAKVAGGVVVAGATMAALGYGLENAGSLMGKGTNSIIANVGSYVEASGRGLFTAGKYTAYTVLVPAYMAVYQGPRWVVTTGLPESARLFNSYVLQPGAANIRWLANKAADGVSYVNQHAIKPIVEKAADIFNQYVAPTATRVIEWSKDKLVALYDLSAQYVFTPVANAAKNVLSLANHHLTNVYHWAATHAIKAINLADDYVAQPLMNLAARTADAFKAAAVWASLNVLAPIGDAMAKVGQIASTYLFAPVANAFVAVKDAVLPRLHQAAAAVAAVAANLFAWVAKGASEYVWTPVAALASAVALHLSNAAAMAHSYVVEPVAASASKLYATAVNDVSRVFGY